MSTVTITDSPGSGVATISDAPVFVVTITDALGPLAAPATILDAATWTGTIDSRVWTNHGTMTVWGVGVIGDVAITHHLARVSLTHE